MFLIWIYKKAIIYFSWFKISYKYLDMHHTSMHHTSIYRTYFSNNFRIITLSACACHT